MGEQASIRAFTPEDYGEVVALWCESGLTIKLSDTLQELKKLLALSGTVFLVAEANRNDLPPEIVGAVIGAWDGHRAWIYHLAVKPFARRGQIGSKLMRTVEQTLRDQGATKINLHIDPAKIAIGHEFRRRYPPDERDAGMIVVRTGKSIFVPEITEDLLEQGARSSDHLSMIRELGLKSVILVPLRANDRTFGLISFVTAESDCKYSEADLAFAEDLGRRAATAVHNARLFTESTEAQEALQRSNAQLQRANEDLNQFAYSASHDLQEPLRIMAIYSQLVNRKYEKKLDEKAREYLNFIVDGAKRMEMLLRDLLVFIQAVNIAHGELPPVNTCAALKKAVANLKSGIIESQADIRYSDLIALTCLRFNWNYLLLFSHRRSESKPDQQPI